jgi:DNA-binding LacI/PurR family transcriptional regulator
MRLEDVAKRAKVSMSTVSRVVNGLDNVRASTRKRVLAALEELNYTPNLQARSLVSGQSKTIGIIVSNLSNPFFVDLIHRLELQAQIDGFEVVLANTNYDPERLHSMLQMMLGRRVAGLAIAVSETLPKELLASVASRVSTVCFNTGEGDEDIGHINLNARKGIQKLVEHLYSLGHRRMAYIGHQRSLKTTEERRAAFVYHANRLGIEHTTVGVDEQDSWEGGRDAVRELVKRGFNASAIVCVNDITAFGVLRELCNSNISVPSDVSVTGFDNIAISEFSCPSLTTVHIPREHVARMMLKMLTSNNDPLMLKEYMVDPEIVIRESTGSYNGGGLLESANSDRVADLLSQQESIGVLHSR